MIERRLTGGDLVRPQPGHWNDLRTYLHPKWPVTPPICFVVEGDDGDGVIVVLGLGPAGAKPRLVDGADAAMYYDLLEDSTDYQASREGKKHVLASGLIEWAAIESRKIGDFTGAAWLDEQQHQLDVGNYKLCADMMHRMYPAFDGQLA